MVLLLLLLPVVGFCDNNAHPSSLAFLCLGLSNCAMPYYGIASIPMINALKDIGNMTQVWYADDGNGCGSLNELHEWWVKLGKIGPEYGYNPNAGKMVLIVKNPDNLSRARTLFSPLGITITATGETSWCSHWVSTIQNRVCRR